MKYLNDFIILGSFLKLNLACYAVIAICFMSSLVNNALKDKDVCSLSDYLILYVTKFILLLFRFILNILIVHIFLFLVSGIFIISDKLIIIFLMPIFLIVLMYLLDLGDLYEEYGKDAKDVFLLLSIWFFISLTFVAILFCN